ncbi:MAG TPA: 50S ribosomal protein L30 [Terriglobales bacterium]|nr:50S ribosomal protein L30 [Terriglobales bacterium]
MPSTIRIQYYRSAIGRSWRQKAVVKGLGLTKLNQVVVRPDNPGFRGMVAKIPHLIRIVPENGPGGATGASAPRQAGGAAGRPRP